MLTFKMYLRVLCAVFVLSVPLATCLTNSSSSATENVQLPQLSTLERFLRTQQLFAIVNPDKASDALRASPGPLQMVTSDNYPLPYPVTKIVKQRLSVTNATGMNIIINDLDIDPTSDYISLTPLNADGSESRPIILTGKLKEPLNIRSLGYTKANLVFEARTIAGHTYKGFSITYAPFGEIPLPSTQAPDITIPFEELETFSKLLVITKNDQNEITWYKLKQLFAVATNDYLNSTNMTLEQAMPENVTLTRVAECFGSWPESEDCVEVEFAITLYNDTSKIGTIDPYLEDRTPREPAGLNDTQLEEMWEKFGRLTFERSGIAEYELPDTRTRILMWVGIAIGTCVLLFLILVAIFRSPAFRDRWIEDDTVAIKNKEENNSSGADDITIYPSPDQVIPELYPVSQMGSNGPVPQPEYGMDVGRIRQNNFETINEGYTPDERPSTRM